jgi:transmembrane sensor
MNDFDEICSPMAEQAGEWCRIIAERPLSPLESADFEAWLDADAEHRSAFERASFIWRALDGRAAPPELVAMRMDALSALVGQDDTPAPARWRRSLVRRTGFGAIAASIVAAVSFIVLQPTPAASAVEYATALGERRVVILDDGSRLSMDAASNVSVAYSKDRRELELISGRAKFDVAKDPLKPFTVAAGDKIVVASGTSFSVEILSGQVNVTLFEGRVAVLDRATRRPAIVPLSGSLNAADQLLKPGQELTLPASGVATLETIDPARATSWEAGQLSFADEPLGQAVERMNRYSRTKFAVGDAAAAKIEISGVLNSDNVDGFVSNVTDVFPVRTVRRETEVVFVTAK